jgi:hypothetical protein
METEIGYEETEEKEIREKYEVEGLMMWTGGKGNITEITGLPYLMGHVPVLAK